MVVVDAFPRRGQHREALGRGLRPETRDKKWERGADWLQLVANVRRVLGRVAEAPWHGAWRCWGPPWLMGADKCRNTQGRVDGASSYQERCLRLALPSAGSLPSAVGSIGIEPTADGPWRRLSGAQLGATRLGPWAHPSGASRENGHGVACNHTDLRRDSRGPSCSFRKFMDDSWKWNAFFLHHSAGPNMTRIATVKVCGHRKKRTEENRRTSRRSACELGIVPASRTYPARSVGRSGRPTSPVGRCS